jgi:2,3,4,5-tetrahydropyridine-2,6-dicarboxylate N-succinyltransferase
MRALIESAWADRELLKTKETQDTIREVVRLLDIGELRVAEPTASGDWITHDWVKKAVILYFPIQQMETIEVGPMEFHLMPLRGMVRS